MSAIQLFDISGQKTRFGVADDGKPYAVASDYAKAMGYRQTKNALDLLDDDEKGFALAETPGGTQRLAVIYEDGLWELIFRSSLPGAKAIKKRVKAILREIRETGSYSPAVPKTLPDALRAYATEVEAHEATKVQNAKLKVKAEAFDDWINGKGCYLVGTVAKMLSIGPKTLWDFLYDEKILINRPGNKRHREPYSRPDTAGWFEVKGVPPERANGHATRTTYLTPYGAEKVRLLLIKRGRLPHEQLALIEGGTS